MKTAEIIKMPKGYYVKKIYGANVQMQFVKTKKEAEEICKAWKREAFQIFRRQIFSKKFLKTT